MASRLDSRAVPCCYELRAYSARGLLESHVVYLVGLIHRDPERGPSWSARIGAVPADWPRSAALALVGELGAEIEPEVAAPLVRQDDRFASLPYRGELP